MDNITRLLLEQLDIKTLRAIEKYCEKYLTYSVDFKQVINKYGVKVKNQDVADLQEYCNFMLVMKQAEIKETEKETKANSALPKSEENITSGLDPESNKKEKK